VKKLNVLDWGESVIDALCESGRVRDPADLYTLDDDELSAVELSGRRVGSSSKTMLDNLHAKMELDLHVLIGSLGIPLIGRSMAKTVADGGFDTLDAMFKADAAQVAAIPGMGKTKAVSFVDGLDDRQGHQRLHDGLPRRGHAGRHRGGRRHGQVGRQQVAQHPGRQGPQQHQRQGEKGRQVRRRGHRH
jgi:DNA ligase (NAD+)